MLPPGPAPERLTLTDGQAPWSLMTSSTSGGTCSGLDPFAGLYIHTAVRGIPVMTSTLWPLVGTSSSSSSAPSSDQDSSDDYPEIGISVCGDSAGEGHLIFMVAPNGDLSHNSSSRYSTIGRSEAFDARMPNDGMIQNLNLNFNAIRLQTIMESIQRMTPEGSPLIALAQQGAEVVNVVVAQRSASNPRGEPSVGNRSNDRGKRAQSEASSSASGNRCLADNDTRRWITQNCYLRECGRDHEDLCNIIDDRRHRRARSPTPPRHSPARDVTPSGRGGFRALAPSLKQLSSQINSRSGTSTSMMALAIPRSSSRSTILSSRPQEETIG
jgi:hypothetical protein